MWLKGKTLIYRNQTKKKKKKNGGTWITWQRIPNICYKNAQRAQENDA